MIYLLRWSEGVTVCGNMDLESGSTNCNWKASFLYGITDTTITWWLFGPVRTMTRIPTAPTYACHRLLNPKLDSLIHGIFYKILSIQLMR